MKCVTPDLCKRQQSGLVHALYLKSLNHRNKVSTSEYATAVKNRTFCYTGLTVARDTNTLWNMPDVSEAMSSSRLFPYTGKRTHISPASKHYLAERGCLILAESQLEF